MKKLLIILLFTSVCIHFGLSQKSSYLELGIDGVQEKYKIENAFLHDSVTIRPDTTVQVSSTSGYNNYFYPKLVKGNKKVMRLILTKEDTAIDFIIEFEESQFRKIKLNDENCRVFMNPGFRLQTKQQEIKDVSGKLEFLGITGNNIRKAKLDLNFKQSIGSKTKLIAMKGDFKPRFSDLDNENIFTEIAKSKGENKNLRHLELAGILVSIFLVFLFTK